MRRRTIAWLLAALLLPAVLGGCVVKKQGGAPSYEALEAQLPEMPPLRNVEPEEENPYEIESRVAALAEVEIVRTKGGEVTCRVSAPDMYTMILDYLDSNMEASIEMYYKMASAYLQDPDCPRREVEITVPAVQTAEGVGPDESAPEYLDAVSGGMYSALEEIAQRLLTDMMEEDGLA